MCRWSQNVQVTRWIHQCGARGTGRDLMKNVIRVGNTPCWNNSILKAVIKIFLFGGRTVFEFKWNFFFFSPTRLKYNLLYILFFLFILVSVSFSHEHKFGKQFSRTLAVLTAGRIRKFYILHEIRVSLLIRFLRVINASSHHTSIYTYLVFFIDGIDISTRLLLSLCFSFIRETHTHTHIYL